MSDRRSSLILGISLGILLISVGVVGYQSYYQGPDVTQPDDANYTITPSNIGFLVTVDAENELSDEVTVQFLQEGTDSEDVIIKPSDDPVYVEPTAQIGRIQAVSIMYNNQTIHSSFISDQLTDRIDVPDIDDLTVGPNQEARLSITDFVNESSVREYSWDTGLQVIENSDFRQTYEETGVYNASLTVRDVQGRRYSTNFNVVVGVSNQNPTEVSSSNNGISASVQPGEIIKLNAGFTTDSSEPVDEYQWNFQNGVTGYGNSVSHVYREEGVYNVTVTAEYADRSSETQSMNIIVTDTTGEDVIVSEKNGYEFEFIVDGDSESNGSYQWDFGDGTTVEDGDRVTHTYDEYGTYDIEVMVGDNIYTKTVETEVLVEMGEEPYSVEFVSGNHADDLLGNSTIGSENPDLIFQRNTRYRITGIPVPIEFTDENENVLLSQTEEGSYENDTEINWREVSDSTVEFTVTEELGNEIYQYDQAADR